MPKSCRERAAKGAAAGKAHAQCHPVHVHATLRQKCRRPVQPQVAQHACRRCAGSLRKANCEPCPAHAGRVGQAFDTVLCPWTVQHRLKRTGQAWIRQDRLKPQSIRPLAQHCDGALRQKRPQHRPPTWRRHGQFAQEAAHTVLKGRIVIRRNHDRISEQVHQAMRSANTHRDPQIDFLREDGVAWGVVGESVQEHNTVENIERLMSAAKASNMELFVSPHWYYPTDHGWKFEGALEKVMHSIKMFDRAGQVDLTNFENSGADFMPQYKKYIHDGKTIVANPHKVYGPQNNDLALQLRKRRIDQVILAGMSANLCVEAHLRDLLENGFEVAVARDATAAAKVPEGDGYLAAIINFRYLANAVWTTDEAVRRVTGT